MRRFRDNSATTLIFVRTNGRPRVSNAEMEIRRRTWAAALKLAVVLSLVAAIVAIAASAVGDVPAVVIVLPVVVIAFTLSWVQTGRVLRTVEVGTARNRHTAPIG